MEIVTLDPTITVENTKLQSFWIGSRVGIGEKSYELSFI